MASGVVALSLGAAAFGAVSSAQQAKAANRLRRQTFAANARAAQIQSTQIGRHAALERRKTSIDAAQIRSTIRAAAGERIGMGGTQEALLRQADIDEAINTNIITENEEMAKQRVASGVPPLAPRVSPILAGIMGGLGGAQTGLSLGTSSLRIAGSLEPGEQR